MVGKMSSKQWLAPEKLQWKKGENKQKIQRQPPK